ncbi:MAG: endolytic transglycosylase MltG, partial [bacterium]
PLAADPTIKYFLEKPTKHVYSNQTAIKSPYNTYLYLGLPPGPICNPGLAAIQAVLSPTMSDYLYYLTAADGKTYYAKTLAEHAANKAKYL